jgi:hypothetical protein
LSAAPESVLLRRKARRPAGGAEPHLESFEEELPSIGNGLGLQSRHSIRNSALMMANCGFHGQSRDAGSRLHLSLGHSGLTDQPPSPAPRSALCMGRLPHAEPPCWRPSLAATETLASGTTSLLRLCRRAATTPRCGLLESESGGYIQCPMTRPGNGPASCLLL